MIIHKTYLCGEASPYRIPNLHSFPEFSFKNSGNIRSGFRFFRSSFCSYETIAQLNPSSNRYHNVSDMMAVAAKVGLNRQRASEIIQEIETLVKENKI